MIIYNPFAKVEALNYLYGFSQSSKPCLRLLIGFWNEIPTTNHDNPIYIYLFTYIYIYIYIMYIHIFSSTRPQNNYQPKIWVLNTQKRFPLWKRWPKRRGLYSSRAHGTRPSRSLALEACSRQGRHEKSSILEMKYRHIVYSHGR